MSRRPGRVIVIVLDSVGIGELPDAPTYRDEGSNTVGNIARRVPLRLPPGIARVGLEHFGGEALDSIVIDQVHGLTSFEMRGGGGGISAHLTPPSSSSWPLRPSQR